MPKEWRATRTIKQAAKILRRGQTPMERRLWWHLQRKQLGGLRFRRQHPIGRFIVDFYCPAHRLVVEIDGDAHGRAAVSRQQSVRAHPPGTSEAGAPLKSGDQTTASRRAEESR